MASGDLLAKWTGRTGTMDADVTTSGGGSLALNGGSTPKEIFGNHCTLTTSAFPRYFMGRLPSNYAASTGIRLKACLFSDLTGSLTLYAAFRRLNTGETWTANHTYTYQNDGGTSHTAGNAANCSILFSASQADSLAADEPFIVALYAGNSGVLVVIGLALYDRG